MSDAPRQVLIVSHTHWDREWYQTAHEFRVDLERVVAGVLAALEPGDEESSATSCSTGRPSLLADYLDLRPDEAAASIARLCAPGASPSGPGTCCPTSSW